MDHEISRLINTTVDAFGRPINTVIQQMPSWLQKPQSVKVEVSETPKSTIAKDIEIAKNMALGGYRKEEIRGYLEESSQRMKSFETPEQKEQYFNVVIAGLQQAEYLAIAQQQGIHLTPEKLKGVDQSQKLEM
jgi:hypothetical protein